LAEFYKTKGLTFAEADINRLDFLYHYFEVVDIDPDIIFEDTNSEKHTVGFILKEAMNQYNSMYSRIMQIK